MPIFAAWIGSLFMGMIPVLCTWFARRTAVAIATAILIAGAWGSCYATLKIIFGTLGLVMPSELANPIMLVKPTHFDACLSAFIAGRIAIAGYKWAKETARAISFVASSPTGSGKGVVGSVSSGPTGDSNPGNLYGGL